jgi:signal transduction histidine kinase
VAAIIHGDLKHRLPTNLKDDEFNTLARTINGMLEQIEQLVHGVRNVSNSIAHDLRTPLAELRSRLEELALMRPPPETAFAEIDGAVADVDRVIRIFDALLRLAEIDAGLRRSGFVPLDLVDLAATAVEFYAPAAELKNIRLQFHAETPFHAGAPFKVFGDPILLAQALSNLVDNALKYAPEHGLIDVAIRRRADAWVEIAVTDNGPGIDDAEKAKVIERFYRGDASRGTPGVGLGLSLAQAVAKLHGSALEFSDRNPGLQVVLALPLSEPAAAVAASVGGVGGTVHAGGIVGAAGLERMSDTSASPRPAAPEAARA